MTGNALAVLSTTSANTTGYASTGDYIYWPYTTTQTWYPVYWPQTYYYHTSVTRDDGEKALKIAKALLDKKLIQARSAEQFIRLIDTILKELKSS